MAGGVANNVDSANARAEGGPLRVVVVDDNELTRPGFVQALDSCQDITVLAAMNHDEALAWDYDWKDVDAVVVDAADEGRAGDQYPGVAVVRRVRAAAAPARPLVIVVTGHYLHDGLRHRMAEADADFFFLRSEVRTAEQLVDAVTHPENHRRGVPPVLDPDARRILGVGDGADVEPLISYVAEHGLERAFDPDQPERDDVRSRRWARHRQGLAAASKVDAVNLTTGMPPQGHSTPSIRQLRRVWSWAARTKRPPT